MYKKPLNLAGLALFKTWPLLGALAWCGASGLAPAQEDPLTKLHHFLQAKTFKATFSQVVYNAKKDIIADVLGTVVLARPERFRWEYNAPNHQIIVSDGLNLMIYDPDLKQASVRPVLEALGDAPITLLMGKPEVFERFEVERTRPRGGLDWIILRPKDRDLEFTQIRLGMDEQAVVRMELLDHFAQTTVIKFLRREMHPRISADAFKLRLPETVDLIGQYALPTTP